MRHGVDIVNDSNLLGKNWRKISFQIHELLLLGSIAPKIQLLVANMGLEVTQLYFCSKMAKKWKNINKVEI